MKDFLINTAGNIVKTGFDFSFTQNDIEYIIQRLQIKLRTFLGEYFLDTSIGVDYFNSILIKNPDMGTVNGIIKKQILSEPTVNKITKYDANFDSVLRKLSIIFTVNTTGGISINGTVVAP